MKAKFNPNIWNRLKDPTFEQIKYGEFKEILNVRPIVAMIVVNEVEKKAVLSKLKPFDETNKRYCIAYKNQTYYLGKFGICPTVIVQSSMGIDDPAAATLTVSETITTWKTHIVIAVGVAMGLKRGVQKEGDVLISQMIQNYNKVKETTSGKIERGARPLASSILCDRFRNSINWNFKDANGNKCYVHHGLIITGGSLVNHPQYVNTLKKRFPDAIGNEMEASGIWAASERAGKNIHWIIVKGICDWGIKKTDTHQPLAATAAVSLCEHVLSSESTLDGIIKPSSLVHKTKELRINSLKLYYYRHLAKISSQILSQKTDIPETRIKELESFHISSIQYNYSEFPICSLHDIKKIEKVICNGRRILAVKFTPKDYMGYLLSFYNKEKLGKPYNNIRAVVFDFDGTMTKSQFNRYSTWERIWVKLGYSINDCRELHNRFSQGDFDHQEWCNLTCKKFQERHMTNRILTEIANEIQLIDGVIYSVKKLKNNNIHLFIASGSIRDVIIKVLGEENAAIFEEIHANRMEFTPDGGLYRIIGTKYDFEGKCKFIENVANELRINPSQILFVGNSNNDQLAYKSGAITLCVNPHETDPQDKEIWHNNLCEMTDFHQIIPYIDQNLM